MKDPLQQAIMGFINEVLKSTNLQIKMQTAMTYEESSG